MPDLSLGPWTRGIDNVSEDGTRPPGAVKDAVNLDFDRAGGLTRRRGRLLLESVQGVSSLWKSPATGVSYCAHGPDICRLNIINSAVVLSVLYTRPHTGPVTWDDMGDGRVLWADANLLGSTDGELLGIEDPALPMVSASGMGSLTAGRYGVAISYLRNSEESALSPAAFVQVADNGGLLFTLPSPSDPAIDMVRIYRTEPNGTVYYHASDAPISISSYILGASTIGRAANNVFLERMRGGAIARYWRGHVLVSRGSVLYFSEAMRYGLTDPRHDFVQFPARILLMQPVAGGVFVGTEQGVTFLRGERPSTWQSVNTAGKPPIEGTGLSVIASDLGGLEENLNKRNELFALWLAENGFVLGSSEGRLTEPQAARIKLPQGGFGTAVVHDRRVVAVIT